MFLKPFRVKSQTQLKSSEKKKFLAEIVQNFPILTDAGLSSIFSSKAEFIVIKAACHKGETVHIYQVQKEPYFFKIDKTPDLIPTVYFLWKVPDLIKTFSTHSPVIGKLAQGADLMLPGIILKGDVTINSYGRFDKGKLVAIRAEDNCSPAAVGWTALSSIDMYMSARQGKGVIIGHVYKDFLWESGSKTLIPLISLDADISPNDKGNITSSPMEEINCELGEISITEEPLENIEKDEKSGPESMDDLFQYSFLKALKTSAKKVELPILTSNFFRVHMVNACPCGHTLDIKKSSFKKLSKFLDAMKLKGYIEVKEFPKGVENITNINFAHEDLKSFVLEEGDTVNSNEVQTTSEPSFSPPVLEEVYQVSGTTIQFFRKNGLSKGDVLSRAEVRQVITSYIEKNNLKRDNKVELDNILHEAAVNPKEGFKEFLRWDEIFSRILGKMAPAVRITNQNQSPVVRKGKLDPIEIVVAKRSGNKKVTLIYNVGFYGINENEFAHQIQVGVATSTSVGAAENKPQGTTQVLVQGNQVAFIAKLLLDTYKLPRKYIKGLELATKSKK